MEQLQQQFHETCQLWEIEHSCEFMKEKPTFDRVTKNVVKNTLMEYETGKTVMGRELPFQGKQIEVDISKFKKGTPPNFNVDEAGTEYYQKFSKLNERPIHCKPVKNTSQHGRETCISISRSMSQATSEMIYPDVPHRWLCENKLLRLLEPLNPGRETEKLFFFHLLIRQLICS